MPILPTDKELNRAMRRKRRQGKPVKPNRSVEASLRYAMGNLWKQSSQKQWEVINGLGLVQEV